MLVRAVLCGGLHDWVDCTRGKVQLGAADRRGAGEASEMTLKAHDPRNR